MRDNEISRIDDVVVVQDQIQIERTRGTRKRSLAAQSLLDVEQSDEQIVRRERRLPYCRRVEEGWLLADADGSRVVKTRDAKRLDEWAQRVECGAQIGFAVADVAAERDRDPDDRLLLPASGQHDADALGASRALADYVFHARSSLLEESPMLERLAQHDAEHRAMPSVSDHCYLWPPTLDECRQMARVVIENVAEGGSVRVLASLRRGWDGNFTCRRRHRCAQFLERGTKP